MIPTVLVARLTLSGLSDTTISIAGASIPDNEAVSGVSRASDSWASVKLRQVIAGNVMLTRGRSSDKIHARVSHAGNIPMFHIADTAYQTKMLDQVETRRLSHYFIIRQIASGHHYYPGGMVILEYS